jgi:hypothetical protein
MLKIKGVGRVVLLTDDEGTDFKELFFNPTKYKLIRYDETEFPKIDRARFFVAGCDPFDSSGKEETEINEG